MISTSQKNEQVVFIGAGNVATHLSLSMQAADFPIRQIFSRSITHAQSLAEKINCSYTTNITEITPDASIYIFTLKDDALPKTLAAMPTNKGIWIHTAGSLPMNIFHGYTEHYGVLYPLQTLSENRKTDFSKIPLFVEGNTTNAETAIFDIAQKLSESVTVMDSEKRKYLHLAAVFACNFTNHLYAISAQILEKQGFDRHLLQPLIDETAHKLHTLHPAQAQTGPAVRNDQSVMEQQIAMLDDENMRQLYKIISESIHSQYNK